MAIEESVGEEIHRMRLSVVERVRTAELRFVEHNRRALDDAMGDIENLKRVAGSLQDYVKAGFELLGYLVYALATMGLAALALFAGLAWLARGMRDHARVQRAELRGLGEREQALGEALDDLWRGMPRFLLDRRAMDDITAEVRARRRALTTQLDGHSEAWSRATAFNMAHPLIVCGLLALLATGPLGLSGDTALGFVALVFLTRGPTFALLNVGELVLAERALARLHDLQRSLDAAQIEPPSADMPEAATLRLDRLVFRFEDGFVLGPISLAFEPGELVFVVGHNGSGKTTLMKVMSGLYPAHGGTMQLGGRPVRRDRLRAAFTVTFIDPYLFDRAYGLDADDTEIAPVLAEVGLAGVVGVRDGAFDSLDLSTGQRRGWRSRWLFWRSGRSWSSTSGMHIRTPRPGGGTSRPCCPGWQKKAAS
ncbi:MAG: ATP-binding cassette domain-containing protein [bacterium]